MLARLHGVNLKVRLRGGRSGGDAVNKGFSNQSRQILVISIDDSVCVAC